MGNQGSFMEKVYVYLPVLMCHSKMDYSDKGTMWNIRTAYFAEQMAIFVFMAYFILVIRRRQNERKILVPDISQGQVLTNNVPAMDELMYRKTTYFEHEMTEVFQQLQQQFVALMGTLMAHFVLGFRPILLLQIFSTPYHFSENRLFRKFVLGLSPGYRVWGERFEGEVEANKVKKGDGEGEGEGQVVAAIGERGGGGGGGGEGGAGNSSSSSSSSSSNDAKKAMLAKENEGGGGDGSGSGSVPEAAKTGAVGESGKGDGEEGSSSSSSSLPMPRALEDKLIDAWDAPAGKGDWGAVMEHVGPFSVNTQTPSGRWSPLMVACGLPQVGEADIKTLVEDLDAQVDLRDQDGWTCLHWAAQQGRAGAARALFEALRSLASEPGAAAAAAIADLRAINDGEGKTAADVARDAGLESGVLAAFLEVLENEAS